MTKDCPICNGPHLPGESRSEYLARVDGPIRADVIRDALNSLGYDLKLKEWSPRTAIGHRNFNERCERLAAALRITIGLTTVRPENHDYLDRARFDAALEVYWATDGNTYVSLEAAIRSYIGIAARS